jgi:hypothetical protein
LKQEYHVMLMTKKLRASMLATLMALPLAAA